MGAPAASSELLDCFTLRYHTPELDVLHFEQKQPSSRVLVPDSQPTANEIYCESIFCIQSEISSLKQILLLRHSGRQFRFIAKVRGKPAVSAKKPKSNGNPSAPPPESPAKRNTLSVPGTPNRSTKGSVLLLVDSSVEIVVHLWCNAVENSCLFDCLSVGDVVLVFGSYWNRVDGRLCLAKEGHIDRLYSNGASSRLSYIADQLFYDHAMQLAQRPP